MKKKKTLTAEQIADAKRLKELFEKQKKLLNLTQQKAADIMGISLAAVGHYLYGRNPLNTKSVASFAKILQVNVADISPSLDKEIRAQSQSLLHSLSESQMLERVPVRLKLLISESDTASEPMHGFLRMDNTHLSAFAVQIIGTGLWPRTKSSEFLIVEPDLELHPGCDAYILLKDEANPLIKMFMHDSEEGYTVTDFVSNRPKLLYRDKVKAIYPITAIVGPDRYLDIK